MADRRGVPRRRRGPARRAGRRLPPLTTPLEAHTAFGSLTSIEKYKSGGFPAGQSPTDVVLFAGHDDIHGALLALIASAQRSLVVAMYAFDDDELAAALLAKLEDDQCFVQLTLDADQATALHERKLLAANRFPDNFVAIGKSEHGSAMHLKVMIIDGLDVVSGSTNWSAGGERLQSNELRVTRDAALAASYRAYVDVVHQHMLSPAAGR